MELVNVSGSERQTVEGFNYILIRVWNSIYKIK